MASRRVIRNRVIASLLVTAAMFGVVAVATADAPVQRVGESYDFSQVCQEDEPCWDCRTMGNGICGPTKPATVEVATYAEAYEWCAAQYVADLNARTDCQWAAYRDFDDATNPRTHKNI